MKGKKTSEESGGNGRKYPVTIRLTSGERKTLKEFQKVGGNASAYIRSRAFGGRPPISKTDQKMINELRRLGGMLKNNFETLRLANATEDLLLHQEKTLQNIERLIDELSLKSNDSQKN